jgi:hypothetical protein
MEVLNPFYYIVVKEDINGVYRFMSINCQTATDDKDFALSYPTAAQAYKRVAMLQSIQPEKLFGVLRLLEEEEVGEI